MVGIVTAPTQEQHHENPLPSSPPPSTDLRQERRTTPESEETGKTGSSARARVDARQQELNQTILKTSLEVTLSAGNQSLGLLLRSAIEHLNEVLAPEFGDNAIQHAYESGLDVTPGATAGRILSMSTAFFDAYREQHPGKDPDRALEDFVALISGGIDRGFAEARQILDGLGVLQGDIASNIERTYELVQEGLRAFLDQQRQTASEG